jgi:excinuclease UvrABC helicase subunit UvrB
MRQVEQEMLQAAQALEFERAAVLRDELAELKRKAGLPDAPSQAAMKHGTITP